MFERSGAISSNNHLSKYLYDNFLSRLRRHCPAEIGRSKREGVPDATRQTFFRL
ncbi:hypothetical protein BDN67DRAFT_975539 [Paxillus ammoniavirescens]|nr:hypothetical protein BDN67DRAFT_975539 [Paxillus ammoniavirescens]